MDINDYLKNLEKKKGLLEQDKIDLEKEIQDGKELKCFLENLGFPVLSFFQSGKKLKIYTPAYSQMLECKLITFNCGLDISFVFNKEGRPEEFYTKCFQFFSNKKIGNYFVNLLLKDEEAEKNKMNVLYEYNSKSGINFPHPFSDLIEFYQSKDLKPSVMIKFKNIIKMSEEILK